MEHGGRTAHAGRAGGRSRTREGARGLRTLFGRDQGQQEARLPRVSQGIGSRNMWSPFKSDSEGEKKSSINEANRHIEALDAKACGLAVELEALRERMRLKEQESESLRVERDSLRAILVAATQAFQEFQQVTEAGEPGGRGLGEGGKDAAGGGSECEGGPA